MSNDQTKNLIDIAIENAKKTPDNPVYSFLNNGEELSEQLSYAQLDHIARGIAANFQNRFSIEKGDRVILLFCPGLDFVRALYACFYAGVIAVPVNPPATGSQSWQNFLSIAENAGASLILADQTKINFLKRQQQVTQQGPKARIFDIADIDYTLADQFKQPDIKPDDIALLQYTSGTTSIPKGVMVSHSNIMHNMKIINEQIYQGHTVTVSWLPIYHDMGLFGAILQVMYVNGHCISMPPSSFLIKPLRWLKAISKYQASVSGGPNFAFDLCVEAIDDSLLSTLDLSSWKVAASGAEPVLAPTLRRFGAKFFKSGFNPKGFVPCYGLAESTLLVCANKVNPDKPPTQIMVSEEKLAQRIIEIQGQNESPVLNRQNKEFVSCGKPEAGQIVIVDTEENTLLDEDQVGEIWIRSDSVASGYWNNPEQSAAVFGQTVNGEGAYYRTGDLGFLHKGEIYISGRIKDLIIIRGKNHYPGDIEHSLQASSADLILDSGAVFAIEIDGTERVVALQEVKQSAIKTINAAELMETIKQAVIKHHELKVDAVMLLRPGRIFKTSSGKIRRSACREAWLAGHFDAESLGYWQSDLLKNYLAGDYTSSESTKAPKVKIDLFDGIDTNDKNAVLNRLITTVANQVGKSEAEIDPDIEYILLGMDSLDAMDMLGDIADSFGVDEDDSLWECETLSDLADNITSKFATV